MAWPGQRAAARQRGYWITVLERALCCPQHLKKWHATRDPSRSGPDIYRVHDLLSKRGWHLNALQRPAALHICFTAAHSPGIVELLVKDLGEVVAQALKARQLASGFAAAYSLMHALLKAARAAVWPEAGAGFG